MILAHPVRVLSLGMNPNPECQVEILPKQATFGIEKILRNHMESRCWQLVKTAWPEDSTQILPTSTSGRAEKDPLTSAAWDPWPRKSA